MKKCLIVLSFLLINTISFSQLNRKWNGILEIQGAKLRIVFNIQKIDNKYTATFDSPDQNAYGLKVEEVLFNESKVIIRIPLIGAVFNGQINNNNEIKGSFEQGGHSIPLSLKAIESESSSLDRPQTPKKPYPYYTKEVLIENVKDKIQLAGTLTLPDSTGQYPVAILISGSGPQDRDETVFGHKPFLVLSDYLTKKGISVLRFDDRGVGKSTGNFHKATSADFASDVESCIHFLHTQKNALPNKIGLIGHSEGGIIATMIAGNNKHIAYVVLMAGSGISGEEIIYAQTEKMFQDLDKANIEQQVKLRQDLISVIKSETNKEVAEIKLREILIKNLKVLSLEPIQDTTQLINSVVTVFNSDWYRFFISYNPATDLARITCPVLALIGEKDIQVLPRQNLPAIESALKSGKNNECLVKEIPNVNHLFQTAKTGKVSEYGEIEETISSKVLSLIANWITDLR